MPAAIRCLFVVVLSMAVMSCCCDFFLIRIRQVRKNWIFSLEKNIWHWGLKRGMAFSIQHSALRITTDQEKSHKFLISQKIQTLGRRIKRPVKQQVYTKLFASCALLYGWFRYCSRVDRSVDWPIFCKGRPEILWVRGHPIRRAHTHTHTNTHGKYVFISMYDIGIFCFSCLIFYDIMVNWRKKTWRDCLATIWSAILQSNLFFYYPTALLLDCWWPPAVIDIWPLPSLGNTFKNRNKIIGRTILRPKK